MTQRGARSCRLVRGESSLGLDKVRPGRTSPCTASRVKTGSGNIPKVSCGSTWTPTLRFVPPVAEPLVAAELCSPPAHQVPSGPRAVARNLPSNSLINSTVAALTSDARTASTCVGRFTASADILAAYAFARVCLTRWMSRGGLLANLFIYHLQPRGLQKQKQGACAKYAHAHIH